jgi:hypothetical protein
MNTKGILLTAGETNLPHFSYICTAESGGYYRHEYKLS